MSRVVKRLLPLTALSCVLMVGGVMPQLPFSAKGIGGVERAVAETSQFDQNQGYDTVAMELFGGGYQKGAYDLNAVQPAPTGANWNGKSRFVGIPKVTDEPGLVQWSLPIGRYITSNGSPVIGADGTVYVASTSDKLYALTSSGKKKWEFSLLTGTFYASPALGADGTIYVGSTNKKVYAINPDGTQKWEFSTGGNVYSSPAIAADGTIYIGSEDKKLYAINPDGTKKWEYSTGGAINYSPAIAADGTVLISSADGKLYAINPDGTQKWVYNTVSSISSGVAVGADGTLYVGVYYSLLAIKPNGTLKWAYHLGSTISGTPTIEANGTIYVGSTLYLYALTQDGTAKWSYHASYSIQGSPLIGADGTIYLSTIGGQLHAVNATGTRKSIVGGMSAIYHSPAMGADGTFYMSSANNRLYAIGFHHLPSTQHNYNDHLMYLQEDSGTSAVIAFDNNYPSDIVEYGVHSGNIVRWQISTDGINFTSVPISFFNGTRNLARIDSLDATKGYYVRTLYQNSDGREMIYQRMILRPDKYTGKPLPTAADFQAPYGETPYAPPVVSNEFLASTGFSDMQGKNSWYYQEWNGTSYVNMTWNRTNNWWQGSNAWTLIGNHWHHADQDTARKFVVPKAGTIKITGKVAKSSTGGGNGVNVKVMKNTTQLWPASGWQHIEFDDATGYDLDLTTTVTQGEAIYFIVNQDVDDFELVQGNQVEGETATAETTADKPSATKPSGKKPPQPPVDGGGTGSGDQPEGLYDSVIWDPLITYQP